MAVGGNLGFACTYNYPHTSDSHTRSKRLDCMMKGLDMAVFQALSRFSNNVHCVAILDKEKDPEEELYDSDGNYLDAEPENSSDDGGEFGVHACMAQAPPGFVGLDLTVDDEEELLIRHLIDF